MIRGMQQKEAVLVAFRISKLRELKNLGPWKLMENFPFYFTENFLENNRKNHRKKGHRSLFGPAPPL